MKIKIEDILIWILILGVIAVSLWLLSGSPVETNALISIAIFVATSELLLWKKIFGIDKDIAVSFTNLKRDIKELKDYIKK